MAHASAYDDSESNIDLNPMLDVVFILLIFFIVTASFVKERVVPHTPPALSPYSKSESIPTIIRVEHDNSIFIDNRQVDANALRAVVAQKQAENENASLVVKAHYQSSAKTYVAIVDAARLAHVNRVTLATFDDEITN